MSFIDSTPLGGFFYDPTSDKEKALKSLKEGSMAYSDLQPTEFSPVDYVGPEAAQDVNFDQAALERAGPSAYTGISVDPRYKAEQLSQMEALKELRDNGGLNLTDRANLQQIQNQEASQAQAQRAAIMQNAQMRGVGGGNTALLDMLTSNQGSANRQSQRDMQVAGMAQDRALNAGNSAANLAGNMSNQEFGQQAQVAAAKDTAAKFNAQMANTNNQFNATGGMQAQLANQQKNQGVNNAAAAAKNNTQTMNQYTMPNQKFGQQATRAAGIANAGRATSDYYQQQQQAAQRQQSDMWGGALGLGMKGLEKFGSGMFGGDGGMSTGDASFGDSPPDNYVEADKVNKYTDEDYAQPFTSQKTRPNYVEKDERTGGYTTAGGGSWSYAHGGMVPGRGQVPGDSEANDFVKAQVSPGEIIVPRSVADRSPEEIAEFVRRCKHDALTQMRG